MKSEIEVPDGWDTVVLGDECQLITKGTTPTTIGFSYQNTGINFIKIESIDSSGNFVQKLFSHISQEANNALKRSIIKENDLLFSIAGALGRLAIVRKEILPANTNQALAIIRLNPNSNIFLNYLYYFLQGPQIQKLIRQINVQSAQANLSLKNINDFKIILPRYEEQQKIADILSKVDEQIDFTEKIIFKTDELKKGLMRRLLTKGIGHAKFKKTELGMIPKEWKIIKTEKQIELSTGFAFKSSEYSENNIDHKLLRGANITRGKLRWKKEITKFWKYTPDFEKFLLEENDIVIGMDGSLVGRNSAIITKKDLPLLLVQRVARLKTKDGLNPKYLFYHIDNGRFIKYVDTVKTNTGIPHISGKNIQNYKITFPPIGEQNRIASILSKVDEHIQDNKKELKHLNELKKGLMQDLLTGKVRVTA